MFVVVVCLMKSWKGVRERGVVRQMYVSLGVMVLTKSSRLSWGLENIIKQWSCDACWYS